MKEEYRLKNMSAKDAKRILECADQKNIDIEKLIDFINKEKEVKKMSNDQEKDDLKRFSEEEKKVNAYIEKHPKISYREAVLTVLDHSEPETKKEFTEEEKQYIEKQEGDLKKVEEYIEKHPGTEYREAVKIVLNKDELSGNEKIVEEYIEKHPGISYRKAVLTVLDKSESAPEKEE